MGGWTDGRKDGWMARKKYVKENNKIILILFHFENFFCMPYFIFTLYSQVWFGLNLIVISISMLFILFEGFKEFREPPYDFIIRSTNLTPGEGLLRYYHTESYPVLWVIVGDMAIALVFTIDLVVRFIVSPRKKRFLLNMFTISDLISNLVVPVILLSYFVSSLLGNMISDEAKEVIYYVAILRNLRVIRLLEAMLHYHNFRLMMVTMRRSLVDILLLSILIFTIAFVYGNVMFYVELRKDVFGTVFQAMWYVVVTISTVGYGDFYPVTRVGYVVGMLCITSGVLFTAMTTTVFVNKFIEISTAVEKHLRLEERQQNKCKSSNVNNTNM